MSESVTRSMTVDVFAPDELRQSVINDIRRYRACCRQCYAVLMLSQCAGGSIQEQDESLRVVPDSDRAKIIALAALVRAEVEKGERVRGEGQQFSIRGGSALGYEMRDYFLRELWPGALSFVWDSLRRDLTTVWTSRDPEFARANRGWLALQGARGLAQFNWRGIGFPVATARPKLNGHTLTLKWHHDRGQVELSLAKLDGGRYHVWRALRDGDEGWKLGTLFLNERDGKLRVSISYERPASRSDVDEKRVCRVKIGEPGEQFILISGPDGAATFDTISAIDALGWLSKMAARKGALERRRAACGNPNRSWGDRPSWKKAQETLSRMTEQRENGVKNYNHCWARRIMIRAAAWRCGKIVIEGLPDDSLLGSHPWKWSQWRDFVGYRADEAGIEIVAE